MRFRWFFLGYLLMFSIPAGKTDIILLPALGYAMMLYAALRLCKYEKEFDRATALETLRLIRKLGFEIKKK